MFRILSVCVLASLTVVAPHTRRAQADRPSLEKAIAEHRKGTIQINAAPQAKVRVEQLKHEFWFGCAVSSRVFSEYSNAEDAAKYKELFLANFNAAVTENAVKWHSMEPQRGQVDYSIVDAILAWTEEHEIPLRGHCIFWGVPGRVQNWIKDLDDNELREVIKNRAVTLARRYRGRIAEFDFNNEMMHANWYEERLGPDITRQMAMWVKQGDPEVVLFANDYDVLTGNRLDDYTQHIQSLLERGVPFQGIGVQGHLHGDSFDPSALTHALDKLADLKLPVRVTEFNFPGQRSRVRRDRGRQLAPEEEEAKAKAIVDYYRICFAHPAVQGILMWGFWEGANWIPASSLYKRDWTPTPAARAYRELIFNEWWTDWSGRADANGRCSVPAFYGKHRVTVNGKETIVELKREEGTKAISLK